MAALLQEHVHATDRPDTTTFPTRPAHTTTGWREDRHPDVSKLPLHSCAAAKMSQHILFGPDPVLTAHQNFHPDADVYSACRGGDSAGACETDDLHLLWPLVDADLQVQAVA
jgi:hypothetical protein